jgi:hypothetical protein
MIDLESLSLFRLQPSPMHHLDLAGSSPSFPRYRPWQQENFNPWTDPPSPSLRPLPPSPDTFAHPIERIVPWEWSGGSGGDGNGFIDPSTKKPFEFEPLKFSPFPRGLVVPNNILVMMMEEQLINPRSRDGSGQGDDSQNRENGRNSQTCSRLLEEDDENVNFIPDDGPDPEADDGGKNTVNSTRIQ